MLVYLAAAWSRRDEIRTLSYELNKIPMISINSRWLYQEDCPPGVTHESFVRQCAINDRDDVEACNTLVRFSDDLTAPTVPAKLASGARMWETGYAYARGKRIIIVGGKQCIFDNLPHVIHVLNNQELKTNLEELASHE